MSDEKLEPFITESRKITEEILNLLEGKDLRSSMLAISKVMVFLCSDCVDPELILKQNILILERLKKVYARNC